MSLSIKSARISLLNELIGYLSVCRNICWDAEIYEIQPGRWVASHSSPG